MSMNGDVEEYGNGVIATADLLHGTASGAYDPGGAVYEQCDQYAAWLADRVGSGWQEPSDTYDLAVRIMAREAVAAWRAYRLRVGHAEVSS